MEVSAESEQPLQNHCVLKCLSTSHLLSGSKFVVRSQDLVECLCMQDEDASSFRQLLLLQVNRHVDTRQTHFSPSFQLLAHDFELRA